MALKHSPPPSWPATWKPALWRCWNQESKHPLASSLPLTSCMTAVSFSLSVVLSLHIAQNSSHSCGQAPSLMALACRQLKLSPKASWGPEGWAALPTTLYAMLVDLKALQCMFQKIQLCRFNSKANFLCAFRNDRRDKACKILASESSL